MPSRRLTSGDPAVEIEGARAAYRRGAGRLEVLDALDLEVCCGEILGLIGPSGCGKTTLLHLIMGLEIPYAGRVRVAAKAVAMVFQKPQLLPWRSVADNAAFGLECRGVERAERLERARDMLAQMGLGEHLDDHPHQLSEGMKQRVNLARALLVEPDLLLMDEPYSALDVMTRRALQDELLERWDARGFTVVFSSHALEEIVYLADRVMALSPRPARLRWVEEVGLSRPRGGDAEAMAALYRRVTELQDRL